VKSKLERSETERIRELLSKVDADFEANPDKEEVFEEYRKKYANVTEEELNKPFTI
jgi:hypothetical protein